MRVSAESDREMAEEKTKKASKGLFGGGKKSSGAKGESGRNTEDEIKKLTRTELLELLIDETKEADRLREDNERLREELAKVKAVRKQVEDALALCNQREEALRAAYQEQDDSLIDQVRELLAQRADLEKTIPADLLKLYDSTAAKTGGVALGKLEDATCGVCRTALEGGRLIELKAQAPLGRCPNCKRLLIVEE